MKDRNIKLIAIDLDDTLLREDNTISSYTRDILKRTMAAGIKVVIATGRMYKTARPVGLTLDMGDLPMILFSGGSICRIESGDILFSNQVQPPVAERVLALAKENSWYIQSYIEEELLIHHETKEALYYQQATGAKAQYIGDELFSKTEGIWKLLVIAEPRKIQEVISILKRELGEEIGLVRSKDTFLEIMDPHSSKGQALQQLGEAWGISASEMVAFGNSENDISMLQMAAIGVAVGNAEPHVKGIAQEICRTNEDDGVAHWIEEYILN